MSHLLRILLLGVLISSCATQKSVISGNDGDSGGDVQTSVTADRDGSSYAKAIVVNSIREEYDWVRAHYPEAKLKGQALSQHKGKPYDILTFFMADGNERNFYFDISKFFGKY